MRRHVVFARPYRLCALLSVSAVLAGCDSPTGPETLAVNVRAVTLASEAERDAWPFTPTIQGGPNIIVRGMVFISCARPTGTAARRGNLIELHIAGDPATTICPAIFAPWQYVEATIVGLAPGSYRVRVTAVGHVGRAEWAVTVIQP